MTIVALIFVCLFGVLLSIPSPEFKSQPSVHRHQKLHAKCKHGFNPITGLWIDIVSNILKFAS